MGPAEDRTLLVCSRLSAWSDFEAKLSDSLSLAVGLGMTPQRASKAWSNSRCWFALWRVYRWVDDGDLAAAIDEVTQLCGALEAHIIGETWLLDAASSDLDSRDR